MVDFAEKHLPITLCSLKPNPLTEDSLLVRLFMLSGIIHITASFGVATYSEHPYIDDLLIASDTRLYDAGSDWRARVNFGPYHTKELT